MARYRIGRIVRDSDGDVVASVEVTVKQGGSETNATIYSDAAGTPLANPFTSASDGTYEFWVDEGQTIDLDFSKSGFSILSQDGIVIPLVSSSGVDHGGVAGLGDDDHTQYALLAGRGVSQTLYGGTNASGDLALRSTTNLTKGTVLVGSALYVDESSKRVGVGVIAPDFDLEVVRSDSNQNTIANIKNLGAGTSDAAVLRTESNAAVANFISHGGGRVISRFGKTLAGWVEFLGVSGNGLLLGTLGATPLIFGTNSQARLTLESSGNVGVNGASYGGGVKVVFLANRTTAPTSNPVGGGLLYVEAGALKYRGSSGTVTTLGPA